MCLVAQNNSRYCWKDMHYLPTYGSCAASSSNVEFWRVFRSTLHIFRSPLLIQIYLRDSKFCTWFEYPYHTFCWWKERFDICSFNRCVTEKSKESVPILHTIAGCAVHPHLPLNIPPEEIHISVYGPLIYIITSENDVPIYSYQMSNLIRNPVWNIPNVHDFLGQPSYFWSVTNMWNILPSITMLVWKTHHNTVNVVIFPGGKFHEKSDFTCGCYFHETR